MTEKLARELKKMVTGKGKLKFTKHIVVVETPTVVLELPLAENLLASLMARAYASDYPQAFEKTVNQHNRDIPELKMENSYA